MGDGQSIFSQTLFKKIQAFRQPVNDCHSETIGIFCFYQKTLNEVVDYQYHEKCNKVMI